MGYGQRVFETDLPAFRMKGQDQWGDERRQQVQEKGDNFRANLAADTAKFPHILEQQRFDKLFPTLQNLMGGFQAQNERIGGQSGPGPQISSAPIWSNQQIQEQVNSGVARNNQSVATQNRTLGNSLAGRGFAAGSPLQQALQNQNQMMGMVGNSDIARQTRWDAAEGNKKHVLQAQMGQEQQFSNRMQEDIERRKAYNQGMGSYISALAGLL